MQGFVKNTLLDNFWKDFAQTGHSAAVTEVAFRMNDVSFTIILVETCAKFHFLYLFLILLLNTLY